MVIRVNRSLFNHGVYHACFDEFVSRDAAGRTHFEGQRPTKGRHRERVWPVLSRYKDQRQRKKEPLDPHRFARQDRLLERASLLTILRRWYPMHPLDARHTLTCDLAQRPPRYDDFRTEIIPWRPLPFVSLDGKPPP
jgi:hypothetical protein